VARSFIFVGNAPVARYTILKASLAIPAARPTTMPSTETSSADTLLDATGLHKRLSTDAGIHDISLTLRRGDVLGLLGLNGAGKSTTLKMLGGTLTPDSGHIAISGFSLSEAPLQARQRIGFLPDTPPLYNDMRVAEYLRFCAKLRRVSRASIAQKLESVLSLCDLHDVARQRIAQLSKGFRQRVGLAQALIHEPDVLLLDEPSNGLDPNQMQGMRNIISQSGEKQAVIFSTHLLNEAKAVCNRIAVVHQGRLIHQADVSDNDDQLEALFTGLVHEHPQVADT